MPLKRAIGFINANAENINHTIAHELAHGIFALKHTFPDIAEKTTQNLMDYGGGVDLIASQWKQVHDPKFEFLWFQKDEEGEYSIYGDVKFSCVPTSISKTNTEEVYLDPDGKKIKLTEDYEPISFFTKGEKFEGVLAQFKRISDGVKFHLLRPSENKPNREGYHVVGKVDGKDIKIESYTYPEISEETPLKIIADKNKNVQVFRGADLINEEDEIDCSCSRNDDEIIPNGEIFFTTLSSFDEDAFNHVSAEELKERYDKVVSEAVEKLNYSRINDPNLEHSIIGMSDYLTLGNEQLYRGRTEFHKELELKTKELKRISVESGNEVNFYVLYSGVNFIMQNNEWNSFAKDVFEKSSLNGSNSILITVPFYEAEGIGYSEYNKTYFMPGLYCKAKIDLAALKGENYSNITYENFINDVYINLAKPYVIHSYAIDFYGRIQYSQLKRNEYVSGYNIMSYLDIVYDQNLHDFCKKIRIQNQRNEHHQANRNIHVIEQENSFLNRIFEKEGEFGTNEYELQWVKHENNINPLYIDQNHVQYVNHFIASNFNELKFVDPGDISIDYKLDKLTNNKVLATLDFFSIITSPVGGDYVFDAVAVIYVYEVEPTNQSELAFRLASFTLPAVVGGVVVGGKIVLKKVKQFSNLKNFGKGFKRYLVDNLNYRLVSEFGEELTPAFKTWLRNTSDRQAQLQIKLLNTSDLKEFNLSFDNIQSLMTKYDDENVVLVWKLLKNKKGTVTFCH